MIAIIAIVILVVGYYITDRSRPAQFLLYGEVVAVDISSKNKNLDVALLIKESPSFNNGLRSYSSWTGSTEPIRYSIDRNAYDSLETTLQSALLKKKELVRYFSLNDKKAIFDASLVGE